MESTTPLGGVFLIKRNRFIKNQYYFGAERGQTRMPAFPKTQDNPTFHSAEDVLPFLPQGSEPSQKAACPIFLNF